MISINIHKYYIIYIRTYFSLMLIGKTCLLKSFILPPYLCLQFYFNKNINNAQQSWLCPKWYINKNIWSYRYLIYPKKAFGPCRFPDLRCCQHYFLFCTIFFRSEEVIYFILSILYSFFTHIKRIMGLSFYGPYLLHLTAISSLKMFFYQLKIATIGEIARINTPD